VSNKRLEISAQFAGRSYGYGGQREKEGKSRAGNKQSVVQGEHTTKTKTKTETD
jgi:hypothetical protein